MEPKNRKTFEMTRGRKLGQTANPRDERGWMVPRTGTKRRAVYDLLVVGKRRKDICAAVGITKTAYKKHRAYITKTEHMNAVGYAYAQRAFGG
jgi:FixJ family two-component response regulator